MLPDQTPVRLDLPAHVAGDTFCGLRLTFAFDDGSGPWDLSGATVAVDLNRSGDEVLSLTLGSGLTLVDGPGGIVEINPFPIPVEPGQYVYALTIVQSGARRTWLTGFLAVRDRVI